MQQMGVLGQEILALNLYSHYCVAFGKPLAKSEPQLRFSRKLERMLCRDSFVNKCFECTYIYVLRCLNMPFCRNLTGSEESTTYSRRIWCYLNIETG